MGNLSKILSSDLFSMLQAVNGFMRVVTLEIFKKTNLGPLLNLSFCVRILIDKDTQHENGSSHKQDNDTQGI